MQAFKRNKILTAALVLTIFVGVISPTRADFAINEMKAKLDSGKLLVSGNLDLTLGGKVEEAVSKGIPLDIDIELELYQTRKLLWAKRLSDWTLRRQIRYHALSGQYLVSERKGGVENLENFTSLQQALRHMGSINDRELNFEYENGIDRPLVLDARVSLDIESLPAPLRPVAYTSLDWHLNSGWTTWNVER